MRPLISLLLLFSIRVCKDQLPPCCRIHIHGSPVCAGQVFAQLKREQLAHSDHQKSRCTMKKKELIWLRISSSC